MLSNYWQLILVVLIFEVFAFSYSIVKKRQDIADVLWGPTFILISIVSLYLSNQQTVAQYLITILVTVWGTRLALHIGTRKKPEGDDPRYIEISKKWGKYFYPRSFLQTFLLQGCLALLISLPITLLNFTNYSAQNINLMFIGMLVWILGFSFESISDRQLKHFLGDKNNKGKIMQSGLWRFSRHPNYFGEITLWYGIFFISITDPTLWPIKLIGPAAITVLILFVSGIPLLERRYQDNPEYITYKKKTSILIPLPPKKG